MTNYKAQISTCPPWVESNPNIKYKILELSHL